MINFLGKARENSRVKKDMKKIKSGFFDLLYRFEYITTLAALYREIFTL